MNQCNIIEMGGLKNGYFSRNHFINIKDLKDNLNNYVLGGPSIPSIAIVCSKCGFISSHALGVLGLLPKQIDESQKGGENGK